MRKTWLGTLLLLLLLSVAPGSAAAQPMRELIAGAWSFVSVVAERDDGAREEPFGSAPRGVIIFTPDGHFSLFQSRAELPRLAANDRARATPEEAMAVVRDSIAYFGTYSVDEDGRRLSLRLAGSTYTNLPEAQTRIVTLLTATELHFTNPRTPSGVTLRTVWRRAPPA